MSPIITIDNGSTRYRSTEPTPAITPLKDIEKSYDNTISGTARLIKMRQNGMEISDEDIKKGIEINAERLGITPDELREKAQAILEAEKDPINNF